MHRQSYKRGLSPVRTRSVSKRQRLYEEDQQRMRDLLEEQAIEDRAIYEERRSRHIDNADRLLLPQTSLLGQPRYTSRNTVRRLDLLRTTGNQYQARALRQHYQPFYGDLFYPDGIHDYERGLYRCANCGKLATPEQIQTWFNPGFVNTDMSVALGIYDGNDDSSEPANLNNSRVILPPSPRSQTQANDYFVNDQDGRMIAVPTHPKPVHLVCSQRCADEQAMFNTTRQHRLENAQTYDRHISSQHPRGSRVWFDAMWNRLNQVRIPFNYDFFLPTE